MDMDGFQADTEEDEDDDDCIIVDVQPGKGGKIIDSSLLAGDHSQKGEHSGAGSAAKPGAGLLLQFQQALCSSLLMFYSGYFCPFCDLF